MKQNIQYLKDAIRKNGMASQEDIEALLSQLNFKIPDDFLEFMRLTNGGDVEIGRNGYLILWKLDGLIKANKDYHIEEFAPNLFLYGSDGSGTAYAFDRRDSSYVKVPFMDLDEDEAINCGKNFNEFIEHLVSE